MSTDKTILIKSANKLLSLLIKSPAVQQQIFQSLEKKDLEMIISNIQNSSIQLRLVSSRLICQLLFQSRRLQQKFCQMMGVYYKGQSIIVISPNLNKILSYYSWKASELYIAIKQQNVINNSMKKQNQLLWFIDMRKSKLNVEYLSQYQMLNLIFNFNSDGNPQQLIFDPCFCVFGFTLNDRPQGSSYNIMQKKSSTNDTQENFANQNEFKIKHNLPPEISKIFTQKSSQIHNSRLQESLNTQKLKQYRKKSPYLQFHGISKTEDNIINKNMLSINLQNPIKNNSKGNQTSWETAKKQNKQISNNYLKTLEQFQEKVYGSSEVCRKKIQKVIKPHSISFNQVGLSNQIKLGENSYNKIDRRRQIMTYQNIQPNNNNLMNSNIINRRVQFSQRGLRQDSGLKYSRLKNNRVNNTQIHYMKTIY